MTSTRAVFKPNVFKFEEERAADKEYNLDGQGPLLFYWPERPIRQQNSRRIRRKAVHL